MRRARISYPGSFHHVMSRGYQGNPIFSESADKEFLLDCWRRFSRRQSITVLAWCILDNHFHLILHNPENTLSRFMKESNGRFGIRYRLCHGGRGSVFDGRFRSTIIENQAYLEAAVIYLLQNPVRAGMVDRPEQYPWSSIHEFHSPARFALMDGQAFRTHVCDPSDFIQKLHAAGEIPESFADRWGESQGSQAHRFRALKAATRRKREASTPVEGQRPRDHHRAAPRLAIAEFLQEQGVTMEELKARHWSAARLRRKLLLILRDQCGLRLKEIHRLEPFRHLGRNSLAPMYQVAIHETGSV